MRNTMMNYTKSIAVLNYMEQTGYPYIVHTCSSGENGKLFPSHSHGRDVCDEPEYLINCRCFGPVDNVFTINEVHTHLEEYPELKSHILNGHTIEMELSDEIMLCLREVNGEFAAVQIAYEGCDIDNMQFIQIYVKGDDFALTDEYYLAGEPL